MIQRRESRIEEGFRRADRREEIRGRREIRRRRRLRRRRRKKRRKRRKVRKVKRRKEIGNFRRIKPEINGRERRGMCLTVE